MKVISDIRPATIPDNDTLDLLHALRSDNHRLILERLGVAGEPLISPAETLRRVELAIMLRREARRRKLH